MAVTRELKLTYGTTTVGAGTSYVIDGKIEIRRSYPTFEIRLTVMASGTTEASFASACSSLESAFRLPDQDLELFLGATTIESLKPSENSGFNIRADIEKAGDDGDTGRSRIYNLRLTGEEPANLSGRNGRRDSNIELNYTSSRRRTVTLSGVYTALGSNTARDQYDASIGAYATSVLNAIDSTVTWELTEETATADDQNKNLDFIRVYEEIVFDQSSASLDDSAIVKHTIRIQRIENAPGDSVLLDGANTGRLATMQITYEAFIDKDVTTDLRNKWEATIKPYLISVSKTAIGGVAYAIVRSAPTFDYEQNIITATMDVQVLRSRAVLEYNRMEEISEETGINLVPVWSGNRFAKHRFDGASTRILTITETAMVSGLVPVGDFFQGAGLGRFRGILGSGSRNVIGGIADIRAFIPNPERGGSGSQGGADGNGNAGYVLVNVKSTSNPVKIGTGGAGSSQIPLSNLQSTMVFEYAEGFQRFTPTLSATSGLTFTRGA